MEPLKNKRRRLWLWITLIFLAVLAAVLFAFRRSGNSIAQTELLAVKKAGFPISSAELNQWYHHPPASNNAALLVEQAISVHVSPSGLLASASPPMLGEALSPELKKAVAAYLEENHEALQKVYAAAQLTENRYSINLNLGVNTVLPHLAHVKGLAQMLRWEAALYAGNGDYKAAARSIKTSFALARTLRDEPILISELVRIACVAISVESLERLLTEHSLDADQLADFSRVLEQAEQDGRQSAFRAMIGERASVVPYFASVQSMNQLMGSSQSVSPIQTISFGAFKSLGLHDRDLRMYLEMMSKFVAASTNDFPEMLRQGDQVQTEMSRRLSHGFGRLAVLTRMMTPAIGKAFSKEAALATRLRCARIALAVEKYRLANQGSLPPNLDALVPDFLEKPLFDPVEGRPFQLEPLKTMNGYQITSPVAAKKLQNARTATFTVSR